MRVFTNKIAVGLLLFLLLSLLGLTSCQMFWSPKSPRGYVMPRPEKIILPKKVNEISGLFFLKDDSAMLSIADDKQKIFRITTNGTVSNYFQEDFAPQEDFEDVVKVDSTVYVLTGLGKIISVKKGDTGLITKHYEFWSKDKNDFETLYYDSSVNGLIMLCKSCEVDKGKEVRNAYRFDLNTLQFDKTPFYQLSIASVQDSLKDGQVKVSPSAAAIHPFEKRLYILASSGHLLIVADLKGNVHQAFRLNPTFYPQVEGIAFAKNGDMYVSNEAKLGKPTLLKLAYKNPGKK